VEYVEKIFSVIASIPIETAIVVAVFALLILAFSSAVKNIAKTVLILAAIILVVNFAAPVFNLDSVSGLGQQFQPYVDQGKDLFDQYTHTTPQTSSPASAKEFSDITLTKSQAQVNYDLLSRTKFDLWSSNFADISSADFKLGTYNSINGARRIDCDLGEGINFSVEIWTDVRGLQVDDDALMTFIVGLACANVNNSSVAMPTHHTIVISSGNCILNPGSVSVSASPVTLLNSAFGYKQETTTYGLNVLSPGSDSGLILICVGRELTYWNSSGTTTAYDVMISGPGRELAVCTLAHELCHSVFPYVDEQKISLCSIAIATDFGQSIFEIAP